MSAGQPDMNHPDLPTRRPRRSQGTVRVFLCGDVMTGRGIDQILPFRVILICVRATSSRP